MIWKPAEDAVREVRIWMKAKGWEDTGAEYDSDRKIYAWRHDVRVGPYPCAGWEGLIGADSQSPSSSQVSP